MRSCSGTPSAGRCSPRRTRRCRGRCRRRWRPAWCRSSASARPRPSATPRRPRRCCARQLEADLAATEPARLGEVVVAYEPIWAIGTGRTATPDQAQQAVAFLRSLLAARDPAAAEAVRILYGGSMKPSNAAELLAQADIDGGLVGGASLDPGDFAAICEAAA